MRRHLTSKLVLLPATLLAVTAVVFVMVRLIPGDPVSVFLGLERTAELEAAFRSAYGLDAPLPVQYLTWLAHIVRGDWGTSLFYRSPVIALVAQRLAVSAQLVGLAMVVTAVLAFALGVAAAARPRSWLDRVLMGTTIVGLGIPEFLSSILLMFLFALKLGWLPATGFVSLATDPLEGLRYLVLPVTALALSRAPFVARVVRASMVEELSQDYVRTARMKGAGEPRVLLGHVLRNALLPALTVLGLQLGFILGGAIVVETIFSIPGLGSLGIQAILQRDYPMVQGFTIVFAAVFLLTNLVVDVCYVVIDPRVRYDAAAE